MSGHTPGPWVMQESATHVRIVGADGENIWHEDKRCPRVMDDASLIAAAPELLEALILMRDNPSDNNLNYPEVCAAILKATGGSE